MIARVWHRRLAKLGAAGVLLWALSGLLHPIMTWTAPRPAVQTPPALEAGASGADISVLSGAGEAEMVRLAPGGYWLVGRGGGRLRLALDAVTGEPSPDKARAHAVALARHYADLPDVEVASAREIAAFDLEYPEINRLLPVWRVQFDAPGSLAVYVDPGSDRLAAVTDRPRRWMLRVFQSIHTLSWLKPVEPLRLAVISVLVGAVLLMAVLGAAMLVTAKGRRLRRVHRWAGLALLPVALAFPASGLFHLWAGSSMFAASTPKPAVFDASRLPAPPGEVHGHLAATAGEGGPVWRSQTGRQVRYFGEDAPADDADRARSLVTATASGETEPVFGFSHEYGFDNKRLPVWRVQTADGPAFIDVIDAVRADIPKSGLARAEGWSFSNLHKWMFATPIGRVPRDALLSLAALCLALLALSGLVLSRRRRRR